MKKILPIFLSILFSFAIHGLLIAGSPPTTFSYDSSGNRTARNTIIIQAPQSEPQSGPNLVGAMPRDAEDEDDCYSNEEVFSTFEMPENNETLDHFYTDRLNESDVVIFPNPTRGALAVEIRNKNPEIPHQITVLSSTGSIVFQKNNITNFTEIDLSAQPRGVYLLRISSQSSFITWKIIKK